MWNWLDTIINLFIHPEIDFFHHYKGDTGGWITLTNANQLIKWLFVAVIFIVATYYVFDVFIIFVKKMIGKKKRKH